MSELRLEPPLTLPRLLDRGVRLTRTHLRNVLPATALPLALVAGAFALAQAAWAPRWLTASSTGDLGEVFALAAAMMVLGLGQAFSMLVGYTACQVAAIAGYRGQVPDMRQVWRTALRPRTVGTMVLMGVLTALGTFACVLPGLFVAATFALVIPVMVEEGRFGTRGLARSYAITGSNPRPEHGVATHPRFWALLIGVSGLLLGYALSFLVQLPFMVVQQWLVWSRLPDGATGPEALESLYWLNVPAAMLGTATTLVSYLFMGFCYATLYHELRRLRDGRDLELWLDALTGSAGDGEGV